MRRLAPCSWLKIHVTLFGLNAPHVQIDRIDYFYCFVLINHRLLFLMYIITYKTTLCK